MEEFYALGRAIERHNLDALIVIGGFSAYVAVDELTKARSHFPALAIPTVLIPASIDNNLPGTELSVGADTAINNNVWALDRIKESAAASKRCFVAEAMGRKCGYLAMMSGISAGAEYIFLNEVPLTLDDLSKDISAMRRSFELGRRLFLVVMNEETSSHYDREFVARAVEAAGEGLFDVRDSALGYIQQGGEPTPFDRLLATRLAAAATNYLEDSFASKDNRAVYLGTGRDGTYTTPVAQMEEALDMGNRRPWQQWWLTLLPVVQTVSLPENDEPVRKLEVVRVEPVSVATQEVLNEAIDVAREEGK